MDPLFLFFFARLLVKVEDLFFHQAQLLKLLFVLDNFFVEVGSFCFCFLLVITVLGVSSLDNPVAQHSLSRSTAVPKANSNFQYQ